MPTDADNPSQLTPSPNDATAKPDGLGEDGTIPNHPSGVSAGHTGTASNFNPEEDEDAS